MSELCLLKHCKYNMRERGSERRNNSLFLAGDLHAIQNSQQWTPEENVRTEIKPCENKMTVHSTRKELELARSHSCVGDGNTRIVEERELLKMQ